MQKHHFSVYFFSDKSPPSTSLEAGDSEPDYRSSERFGQLNMGIARHAGARYSLKSCYRDTASP
jgi:hypothetical protein